MGARRQRQVHLTFFADDVDGAPGSGSFSLGVQDTWAARGDDVIEVLPRASVCHTLTVTVTLGSYYRNSR